MKNYFSDLEFLHFPKSPTPIQLFLLKKMRYSLNIIRERVGTPILITDCFRTVSRYKQLKKKYNPSATSDHFWGQAIPTNRLGNKLKYGPYFTMSAGASDIVIPGMDMRAAFTVIMDLVTSGKIDVGQVILERGKSGYWIHLSNPRILIFKQEILNQAGAIKQAFLKSDDNGKTYSIV